jgi:protein phosphatase
MATNNKDREKYSKINIVDEEETIQRTLEIPKLFLTGRKKVNKKQDFFDDAIRYANRELIEKSKTNPDLKGMGTTLVALTIEGDKAYVANVGDSRLYLMEQKILQITIDHSLVQEMIRIGELTKENARLHPDKNIITRAVGAGKDIKADFFEFRITKESILLMCSDGLSNMVEDQQLAQILKSGQTPEKISKKLVETANKNGGKDNIAVIVIKTDSGEV